MLPIITNYIMHQSVIMYYNELYNNDVIDQLQTNTDGVEYIYIWWIACCMLLVANVMNSTFHLLNIFKCHELWKCRVYSHRNNNLYKYIMFYILLHKHTRTRTHTNTQTNTHTHIHSHTHIAYKHTPTRKQTHTHTYTHTHTHTYTNTHTQ